jgi:hypothetical protein
MTSVFEWTKNREKAALSLAKGETQKEAAEAAGLAKRPRIRRGSRSPIPDD